ncbi:MAG: GNAT family N-acetyltransferase [Chloroflexi bacterium]|nr:GNAT family N-acetyltransferase [Chloroflexota bacterium]
MRGRPRLGEGDRVHLPGRRPRRDPRVRPRVRGREDRAVGRLPARGRAHDRRAHVPRSEADPAHRRGADLPVPRSDLRPGLPGAGQERGGTPPRGEQVDRGTGARRPAVSEARIRDLTELDIDGITRIDERITGKYRPQVWEQRVVYYIRRDPDAPKVAERDGKVVGFVLGEVRGGEFGLDEPTGWLEFFGVDPSARGSGVGRRLTEALLAHFRSRGAKITRTMVAERDREIDAFLRAMGFTPAPLTALERAL